ncbi:catechol oxidase [Salvia divinorum]|uniref:Catechol oxidase n=1 Tax=Salvia divinorum TaxID=28513 RepID=A0ABD1H915_SALDI
MRRMRALDKTDPDDPRGFTQQANIHCAYCNGAHDQLGYPGLDLSVHYSWIFFPFHRWYLYFFERILGSLIDDPDFALPYWNWDNDTDNPRGMQFQAIFNNPNSPLYDSFRNQANVPPAVASLSLRNKATEPTQIISENLSIMYNKMIGGVNSATDFMGQPYRAGNQVPPMTDAGTVERGSHIAIHVWVGDPRQPYNEDLGNFYSAARDPVFYAHHSNVDRMWTIWQGIKTRYRKTITDPDYLNASFLFYDEKKRLVRVKAGDCTDNKALGYQYQKVETPWECYRLRKTVLPVMTKEIARGAPGPEKVFPVGLKETVRVVVVKLSKGNADDWLVLEDIQTDCTKLVKFDVFVNDEDDEPGEPDRPGYAGTYAQLPHRVYSSQIKGALKLGLKELYENIDVGDQESVVVTIVPRINGEVVTIGGVKIIPASR